MRISLVLELGPHTGWGVRTRRFDVASRRMSLCFGVGALTLVLGPSAGVRAFRL